MPPPKAGQEDPPHPSEYRRQRCLKLTRLEVHVRNHYVDDDEQYGARYGLPTPEPREQWCLQQPVLEQNA